MSNKMQTMGRVKIGATIKLLTGLHIGAGKDTIEIGGIDNPVIKHPHSGEPYIPGSSVKGKLRYLLEWAFQPVYESVRSDGKPWGSDDNQPYRHDDPILRIFGTAAKREKWPVGPTRLIVRDAMLRAAWRDEVLKSGETYTEEKTEVVIDRIAGKAHDKIGPRQTERVPAGAVFDLEMVFRLYDTGDGGARDRECLNWLLAGLHLLEQDALGGSGSRGYGRIRFEDLTVRGDGIEDQRIDNAFRVDRFDPAKAPAIVTFAS
jgi:CRISPR-associated protein Csm3